MSFGCKHTRTYTREYVINCVLIVIFSSDGEFVIFRTAKERRRPNNLSCIIIIIITIIIILYVTTRRIILYNKHVVACSSSKVRTVVFNLFCFIVHTERAAAQSAVVVDNIL